VGFTQYFTPGLYGGVDRAKRVYKWHRALGYVILLLLLATVAAATQTETGRDFLELRLWAVLGAAGLVLLGVLPRVKKEKFGFGGARPGVRI
jgi:peptidoglycan/LPS O-acetylase OafA/YrhL